LLGTRHASVTALPLLRSFDEQYFVHNLNVKHFLGHPLDSIPFAGNHRGLGLTSTLPPVIRVGSS
jgi:hypothetical protein